VLLCGHPKLLSLPEACDQYGVADKSKAEEDVLNNRNVVKCHELRKGRDINAEVNAEVRSCFLY
jgi:hypothetical protein